MYLNCLSAFAHIFPCGNLATLTDLSRLSHAGGAYVRIELPSAQQPQGSSRGSSRDLQNNLASARQCSTDDWDGPADPPPAQRRPRQRGPTDPFSDLLQPEMGRKLSIHDRDLWSRHHRQGDL
jgi:hypothetical protein